MGSVDLGTIDESIITASAVRVLPPPSRVVAATAETTRSIVVPGGACQGEGESFCFIVRFSECPTHPLAVTEQREDGCSHC
jgi:hypothetical protein